MKPLSLAFAERSRATRIGLAMTQRELGGRAGVTRGYIAKIEGGRANPSLNVVTRISRALGMDADLIIRPPLIVGGRQQRDAIHARRSGYLDRRLKSAGLLTAREVEIAHARSHGWIDLLAFEPKSSTLLIIEIKTRIDDLGSIERQVGWYERAGPGVAHGLGWDSVLVRTWLINLASDQVEATLRANRLILDAAFPARARDANAWLTTRGRPPAGRVLALVDPASRRREWLIHTRADGRRSAAPYRDYLDAASRTRIS